MRGDAARSKSLLDLQFQDSGLATEANVRVMPNVGAANISYDLSRIASGGVGGILFCAVRPVHIPTPSSTVRCIVKMTGLAVAGAVLAHADHEAAVAA